MKLAISGVLVAFVALSGSALLATNVHASAGSDDCWSQFKQCTARGLPTYKCQDLYELCLDINSAVPHIPSAIDQRDRLKN